MANLLDIPEIFCIIQVPEIIRHSTQINQQKVARKWPAVEIPFSIKEYEISCNIITDHISENVQNKICNFKIRTEQFTDQTKKLKSPD